MITNAIYLLKNKLIYFINVKIIFII